MDKQNPVQNFLCFFEKHKFVCLGIFFYHVFKKAALKGWIVGVKIVGNLFFFAQSFVLEFKGNVVFQLIQFQKKVQNAKIFKSQRKKIEFYKLDLRFHIKS